MSIEGLMTQDVIIYRAEQITNRYGDTVDEWTEYPPDYEETTAWISQRSASELLDHRSGEVSQWVGFFPACLELAARDRVLRLADERTFEVTGPPNPARTPTGGVHHLEVGLEIVEG
jgi:hypothetical protein